jgi:hypothetical protein
MQLRAIRLAALKALVLLLRCAVLCRRSLPSTEEEHEAQVEAAKQQDKERERRERNGLPPVPLPPPPPLADSAPLSALSSLAEAVGYFHEFLHISGGDLNYVKRYVRDLTAAQCDVAVSRAVRLLVEGMPVFSLSMMMRIEM